MRCWKSSIFKCQLSIAVGLTVLFAWNGCGKKADVKSQVTELEKAFPGSASAPAAPVEPVAPAQAQPADVNVYVRAALSAVQANDYAAGVIALQTAQQVRGVSAEQLMAIERTKQAMTADLLNRADRGDAKAKADLAAIEKTRSQ